MAGASKCLYRGAVDVNRSITIALTNEQPDGMSMIIIQSQANKLAYAVPSDSVNSQSSVQAAMGSHVISWPRSHITQFVAMFLLFSGKTVSLFLPSPSTLTISFTPLPLSTNQKTNKQRHKSRKKRSAKEDHSLSFYYFLVIYFFSFYLHSQPTSYIYLSPLSLTNYRLHGLPARVSIAILGVASICHSPPSVDYAVSTLTNKSAILTLAIYTCDSTNGYILRGNETLACFSHAGFSAWSKVNFTCESW